ncbi:hypothetical protein HYT05_03675 [Candidatus Kaiserbacteria bacterium]|nr:hypothetical protein [Candidatus Kaiserbacteria bacterium]
MKEVNEDKKADEVYTCPACGLSYREAEWARKCETWCRQYKSCNLDIIQHAISNEK